MAPKQIVDFDERDDDEMIELSTLLGRESIINIAPQSQDCDCELAETQSSSSSANRKSTIMTPRKELPPSILRHRLHPRQEQPPHWPKRQRVHFVDEPRRKISSSPPSVITAIYYRPRTPIADVSSLYYSALDVKNFKREFRALLRSQELTRQRFERLSLTADTTDDVACPTVQHHGSSFWRSKVSRWSAQAKEVTYASNASDPPLSDGNEESNQYITDCDDDVDYSSIPPSSQGGIFSSVFDVAREAVSLLGTSSSSAYYYQKDSTLYLFKNAL
eukprot:scaffold4908_cov103-Skeletonema_dohrnii-CCMP3373.AAC.4